MTDIIPFLIVIGVIAFSLVGKAFNAISKKQGQAGERRGTQPPQKSVMPPTNTNEGSPAPFFDFPAFNIEEWFPGEHKNTSMTPPPVPPKKKKKTKKHKPEVQATKNNTSIQVKETKQSNPVYDEQDTTCREKPVDWKKAIIAHEILKRKF